MGQWGSSSEKPFVVPVEGSSDASTSGVPEPGPLGRAPGHGDQPGAVEGARQPGSAEAATSDENASGAASAGTPDSPAPAGAPEAAGADASEVAAGSDVPGAAAERGPEQQIAEQQIAQDLNELAARAQKADEYLALAQRTQADFENYRKRAAREAAAAQTRGVARLARELLPAIDNLERALQAVGDQAAGGVPAAHGPAGGGAAADGPAVAGHVAGAEPVEATGVAAEHTEPAAAQPADGDATQTQHGGSAEREPAGESRLADGLRLVHAEVLAALARAGIKPFAPLGEAFDPQHHEAVAQQPVQGAAPGTVAEVYQPGYRLGELVLRPARVLVAA